MDVFSPQIKPLCSSRLQRRKTCKFDFLKGITYVATSIVTVDPVPQQFVPPDGYRTGVGEAHSLYGELAPLYAPLSGHMVS